MTSKSVLAALIFPAVLMGCASIPPDLNDNMVVPGERVGTVEIGMSLADLVTVKGTPRRTIPIEGSEATTYFFDGLTVAAEDEVYWIIAKDQRFKTVEGVAPGTEQIYARAVLGEPKCVVSLNGSTLYDYGDLYFEIDNRTGLVGELGVQKRTRNC